MFCWRTPKCNPFHRPIFASSLPVFPSLLECSGSLAHKFHVFWNIICLWRQHGSPKLSLTLFWRGHAFFVNRFWPWFDIPWLFKSQGQQRPRVSFTYLATTTEDKSINVLRIGDQNSFCKLLQQRFPIVTCRVAFSPEIFMLFTSEPR